ncbi:hypothetical protein SpCBS45565_g07824 [Spizellomyces sp. 'palustris']|nr:hypothetical protein SpCBS45565_g07824 [Spizellomyces sp. 'palustris']
MPQFSTTALHKKLSADTVPVPVSPKRRPSFPHLPNELLLILFESMPTKHVCIMRCISKRYSALATVVLLARFETKLVELGEKITEANRIYRETEREKHGDLSHYRAYLRNVSLNELTEAIWYSAPPPELQTVCECLCILKGVDSSVANRRKVQQSFGDPVEDYFVDATMPWPTIKKCMGRYEFKTWLMNLRVGVDFIPFANVKRVERILMVDPQITYDRLREVSMAGYRLLILVAACWQYCTIAEDLRQKRNDCYSMEQTLVSLQKFVSHVGRKCDGPIMKSSGSSSVIAKAAIC